MARKKVLFLGQKPVGEDCFRLLLDEYRDSLEVVGCVTNTSRSVWWGTTGVADRAVEEHIAVVDNAERNEGEIAEILRCHPEAILLSAQHPWILSEGVLSSACGGAFNVHNAKLPDYKGHNSCNHAIYNGESTYTCTVHRLVADVDMGAIAFEETFAIDPGETALSLYRKAREAGARAFGRLLHALASDHEVPAVPVAGEGRFYGRHSVEGLKRIPDIADAEDVDRRVRAGYFPAFGYAYYELGGRRFYLAPAGSTLEEMWL